MKQISLKNILLFERYRNIGKVLILPVIFVLSVYSGMKGDYECFNKIVGIGTAILLCITTIYRKYEYPKGIGKYVIGVIVIIVIRSVLGAIQYGKLNGDYNFVRTEIVFAEFIIFIVAFMLNKAYSEQFNISICIVSWLIFISAVYGLVDYLIFHALVGDFAFRLYSVYLNPIPGGHIFLFGLWLPLISNNTKLKNREIVTKIIVYMLAIMLSQSRSTWLGLIVSVVVYLICNLHRVRYAVAKISRSAKIICSIVLAIIMCVCVTIFMRIFKYRFSGVAVQQPINLRLNYINYTLAQVANSSIFDVFFGHGFDWSRAMIIQSPVYEEPYGICDNGYMTALYDWGLISIVLVAFIIIVAFIYMIRSGNNHRDNCVKLGAAMSLIASVIPAFFYDVQGWITPMVLILSCMVYFIPTKKTIR
ncbi:O-antigen ligase family protein [Butyrivibrio fibrisolvens]|uniref:O-antigen ligase family protein n=1 Tax=Butyrivibrio fibrisolvens TaxID=831 RepID=UPI00040EC7E3|nr:O-antigen ligase family protein [Butyrivibrio fibrisolvens]